MSSQQEEAEKGELRGTGHGIAPFLAKAHTLTRAGILARGHGPPTVARQLRISTGFPVALRG